VRTLAPHTEAQPEAILLQLLAAFGHGPHCMVGATRHTLENRLRMGCSYGLDRCIQR
jgi:hypothetical protein